jgi:hypothetical protein
VRLPKSLYVEGQVTKADDDSGDEHWSVGGRVTF